MHVARAQPAVLKVGRQPLGRDLGERGDQRTLAARRARRRLLEDIIELRAARADDDRRVGDAGRPQHHFGEARRRVVGGAELVVGGAQGTLRLAGGGGDEDGGGHALPELAVRQRAVVERGGQPEAVGDERVLPPLVGGVHRL